MPACLREIESGQRRQRAASGENGAEEQENKMAQPSRPPTGGPAEGLFGRESALNCFFQDYARELRPLATGVITAMMRACRTAGRIRRWWINESAIVPPRA
jgi:hypothetical protein